MREYVVVDGHCWGAVALAEARDLSNREILRRSALVAALERSAKLIRSAEMAGHVAANTQIGFRAGSKAKMWIKTRYSVETIERNAGTLRQCRQFIGRQIAEVALDGMQLFVDQWQSSGALRFQLCKSPAHGIRSAPQAAGSLGGL